jgi:hypothetical protein
MAGSIFYDDPYGGAGMRTRDIPKAHGRVQTFLHQLCDRRTLTYAQLEVGDPASPEMKRDIAAFKWTQIRANDPDGSALLARVGHTLGETARAAWEALGEPTHREWLVDEPETWMSWRWEAGSSMDTPEDLALAQKSHPGFVAFTLAHWKETVPRWFPRERMKPLAKVALHERWEFHVDPSHTGGRDVSGSIEPSFQTHWCAFFFGFCWPGEEIDEDFVRFYDAITGALGVKLPESRFKISPDKGRLRKAGFKRKDWP